MIKKIWKDPVWSKVIAVGIIALISLIYAKIKSVSDEISFVDALKSLLDIKISVVYAIGIIIAFLILRRLFKKKDGYYSAKQEKLRQFNKTTDPNTGIQFKWGVYFDYDTPFIGDLTAFCTKHDGPPIRFMNDRCPIQGCENSNNRIDNYAVKNFIESDLIDRWEK